MYSPRSQQASVGPSRPQWATETRPIHNILRPAQPSQLATVAYQPSIYDGAFSNCLAYISVADPTEYASITASYTGGLDLAGKKKGKSAPSSL